MSDIAQEIIVTAQKRATSLQDVPFSVAALTNEDIEQWASPTSSSSPAKSLGPAHGES